MISKRISSKVLVIGTHKEGKGGMAILIKSHSFIFEDFNYVCSHKFENPLIQLWLAFIAIFKVIYFCLFKGIKIVHIHSASYRSFYRESIYLIIAKLFRKKIIFQLHGGEFEIFYNSNKKYCDYICSKADVVIGVSKYFGELFKRLNLNSNIIVLYNIAEKPLYKKVKLDTSKEKLEVLFLGAIDDNKGIFEVLDLWSNNRDLCDKFNLTICGIGDDKRLNKFIHENKFSNSVKYLGWIDSEKKNKLLSNTDIYIQPSHFESLGIAIIEALSYGIPVIASNTGGIPELITHNFNGYLIEVGDMNKMREDLLYLYNNRSKFLDFKENAESKATEFFSENIEKQIINMYNKFL